MKVNPKTGVAKLEKGEIRTGNFFVKMEPGHIRLTDLNNVFSLRVSRRIPTGIWLENMYDRASKGEEAAFVSLGVYISAMWSLLSVAPDDGYIQDALKMADDALNRHPDWYGIKADATDEEDAAAIQEVKEMKEFEEEIKALAEKEDAGK